jgi:hypothetical protein
VFSPRKPLFDYFVEPHEPLARKPQSNASRVMLWDLTLHVEISLYCSALHSARAADLPRPLAPEPTSRCLERAQDAHQPLLHWHLSLVPILDAARASSRLEELRASRLI